MVEGLLPALSTDNAPVTVQVTPRKKGGRKPHAITQKQLRDEASARAAERENRIQNAVSLAKEAMTINAVCRMFSVSRMTVRRRLAKLGIFKQTYNGRLPDNQIAAKTVYTRRWAEKYPEKRAAHKAVERALSSGKLVRQPCEFCGAEQTHAHHSDYGKPLDVQWLCDPCHRIVHRMAAE